MMTNGNVKNSVSRGQIAATIDSTLLAPNATQTAIAQLVDEAVGEEFASVCVNPRWVKFVSERLRSARSAVRTCTVIGFPLGANTTKTKVAEALDALANGAEEFDMVADIGAIISGDWERVEHDISDVVDALHSNASKAPVVKVILEICYLDEAQVRKASQVAKTAGADFVKTSTGFASSGATVEAVQWMREEVGDALGVKAAGGIRTAADYQAMVNAGASRVGASAGSKILNELAAAAH